MISVLGIPSTEAPFCSHQLKRLPIISYVKSIVWNDYFTAIGIRYDEPTRVNDNWLSLKLMYPFAIENPKIKRQISEWWGRQNFDLNIDPDDGNCDNCWKKDFPRLARRAIKKPKSFDWWQKMEDDYSMLTPRENGSKPPYYFFRGQKRVADIFEMAKMSQAELKQITMFDLIDGCSESCEVF